MTLTFHIKIGSIQEPYYLRDPSKPLQKVSAPIMQEPNVGFEKNYNFSKNKKQMSNIRFHRFYLPNVYRCQKNLVLKFQIFNANNYKGANYYKNLPFLFLYRRIQHALSDVNVCFYFEYLDVSFWSSSSLQTSDIPKINYIPPD